ncbi:MAG: hypothetical protein AAF845_00950 [Bacteroidota bacterium]
MKLPWTRPAREVPDYVDTPAGILAADGVHYHTTEPLLREYAGPVIEAAGVGPLVRRAGRWLRSGQTVAIVLLPLLLAVLPWWWALALTVIVYALWTSFAPGLALPALDGVLRALEPPVVQALVYITVLSAFAASGRTPAVVAGLAGFVAFRLGAVRAALRPVVGPIHTSLYTLPAADQTLRSVIVREALRRGISLPGIDRIEEQVRAFWRKK